MNQAEPKGLTRVSCGLNIDQSCWSAWSLYRLSVSGFSAKHDIQYKSTRMIATRAIFSWFYVLLRKWVSVRHVYSPCRCVPLLWSAVTRLFLKWNLGHKREGECAGYLRKDHSQFCVCPHQRNEAYTTGFTAVVKSESKGPKKRTYLSSRSLVVIIYINTQYSSCKCEGQFGYCHWNL